MNSNYVDKSRLPSRHVTEGPERAPPRSYLYAMTVTGNTVTENLEKVKWNDKQDVVRTNAISPTGGVVSLRGNLAPDGAIVKVAGLKNLRFSGPARVFDCEEDCFEAVEKRTCKEGDVVTGEISVNVTEEEFTRRKAARKPRETEYGSGAIWKYSQPVGPARFGALANPGAQGEKERYADI